jgi:methionine sulfoxide reductase heme-binding subunit
MSTVLVQRWPIVAYSTLMVSLMLGIVGFIYGFGETGMRVAIRLTARSSCILFLLAFVGSSLAALWPSTWTQWLRSNRRYFGLSFAMSHAWHAIAIVGLAFISQGNAIGYSAGGILGYIFIALMAATSSDRGMEWLGDHRWHILHTVGAHYLWLAFTVSFAERWNLSLIYPFMTGLLVLAMGLRIGNSLYRRRSSQA